MLLAKDKYYYIHSWDHTCLSININIRIIGLAIRSGGHVVLKDFELTNVSHYVVLLFLTDSPNPVFIL